MEDRKIASILFGIIVIIFGVVLLLNLLGTLRSYDPSPWWPALLIFAGALSAGSGNIAIPFGMLSAGAILLARNLGLFASSSPISGILLLLVALGILAIAVSPKGKPQA